MTSQELLFILNGVKNQYILEAKDFWQKKETKKPGSSGSHPAVEPLPFTSRKEPNRYQSRETGKEKKSRWKKFFILSAAVGLLLATLAGRGFFTQWTDYFATFLVKTQDQYQYTQPVKSLIEALFPPKQMSIYLEGFEVEGSYAADGVEPEMNGDAATPGFAIYYDVDYYTMEKEGDVTYIRSYNSRKKILDYYGDSLAQLPEEEREAEIERLMNEEPDPRYPPCEIEIVHLDLPFDEAAAKDQEELDGQWEVQETVSADKVMLYMRNGQQWNSLVEDRSYVSDGQGGCFRIISRYFLEAAEGYGTRFAAMVKTFTVAELILCLSEQDAELGSLVFQYKDRAAIAYDFTPRQMYDLKQDGTFGYSGGIADTGYASLCFTGGSWEYEKICNVAEDNEGVRYFCNGEPTSEEIYWECVSAQNAKEGAEWTEYPSDADA